MLNVRSRPGNKLTKMHSTPGFNVNSMLSDGLDLPSNTLFFKSVLRRYCFFSQFW
jgi:hypothetical protein